MYKFTIRIIALILITLIIVSCKKSSKNDLSLTLKEYEIMGMPDHTKLWSSQAYNNAFAVLSNVKIKNPLSLPRKNSKKSGALFNRFVNKENLSFVDDPSISLKNKAFEIQSFSSVQNTLIRKYTDDFKSEQYYNEELIETYIFGMYVHEKMLQLAAEINNSDDDYLANMKAGLNVVLNGYVQMIYFVLGEQVKTNVYKSEDLDRLSTELSRSVVENIGLLTNADKSNIVSEFRKTIDKTLSDNIKSNYLKVLQLLNDKK